MAAKLKRKMSQVAAAGFESSDSESDTESVSGMRHMKHASSRGFGSLLGKNDQKQARMELKMIVDSSDDAMFCIDEKGKILIANSAASKQFGYTMRELKGNNISIICNSKDAPQHGSYLERYLKTGEKRVMGKQRELMARRKDGSEFLIELGLTEVNLGGGKFIFCGFVKDITELKRHHRNLDYSQDLNKSFTRGKQGETPRSNNSQAPSNNSRAHGIPPLVEWCKSSSLCFLHVPFLPSPLSFLSL